MLRLSTALLRTTGLLILAVYFVVAGLFLAARYWVLPNLDQWRPQIAHHLSHALNSEIRLGPIEAEWNGLNPQLRLHDVTLMDTRQHKVLRLPELDAVLSWRSILTLRPQLVSLEARGIELTVRRDRSGRLWIAGQTIEAGTLDAPHNDADQQALGWLATQPRIALRDAKLRWIDELRGAPPLVLSGVSVNIQNEGADHRFALLAQAPPALGDTLDIRGEFSRAADSVTGAAMPLQSGAGRVYAQVDNMRPTGWSAWADIPQDLESGEVSARAVIHLLDGKATRLTSDVKVEQGRWNFGADTRLQASSVRLYLDGPWNGFERIFSRHPEERGNTIEPTAEPVRYRLESSNLQLDAVRFFEHPLELDSVYAQGHAHRSGDARLTLQAERLDVASRAVRASIQGSWAQAVSGAGLVDLVGSIDRAEIAAIDEHLPTGIDPDARAWMSRGLVGGQLQDATLVLKGDLDQFPFAPQPQGPVAGDFRIAGKYTGGIIDYAPADKESLGWPRLADMKGTVELHRSGLSLSAQEATMWPAPGLPIQVRDVHAEIQDLAEGAVLTIQGATTAEAPSYLGLMKHSPLGAMLDGAFDQAVASGQWQVPLSLRIPLADPRKTTVNGTIQFSGGMVRLDPEASPLNKVKGTLEFSDTHASTTNLSAELLGGAVQASGGLGGTQKGLKLRGRATAAALRDYVGVQGMARLDGVIPYTATLSKTAQSPLSFELESKLEGLALNLPAPLQKSASQAMAFHVGVQLAKDGKTILSTVELGDAFEVRMARRKGRNEGSYFDAVAVGANQKPALPARGMVLDLQYPRVDVDAWNRVIDEFSTPLEKRVREPDRALLPQLAELRLQAQRLQVRGLILDGMTFTARRPDPGQWRVDISSTQTAGTLFWREAKGRVEGKVVADFHRLSLGREPAAAGDPAAGSPAADELEFDDVLDIPAVDLRVQQLRLYGREVGKLSLLGVNPSRGPLWQLNELRLDTPSATLTGTGTWRLSGPQRGLSIQAQAEVRDLGAYLNGAGFPGLMVAGHGLIKGDIEWRNMPWAFSKADLNGKIEVSLEKGRFNNLNSRSARLLELVSLQSLSRLARLDINPRSLTKEGFPYDSLRGTFHLDAGMMSTQDYRVIGPAGTIVLDGKANLLDERLDLQAVVIPSLDVSGAAIAAGIAINPIVGLGAFLTQWLLQAPLSKAMAAQYHIGGTLDEPVLSEVARPAQPTGTSQPAAH